MPPVVKLNVYDSAHEFAKGGRTDALREIIESKEDETFVNYFHEKSKSTFLTACCAEGFIDTAIMLLDYEPKIDLINGDGNTALMEASKNGYAGNDDALPKATFLIKL